MLLIHTNALNRSLFLFTLQLSTGYTVDWKSENQTVRRKIRVIQLEVSSTFFEESIEKYSRTADKSFFFIRPWKKNLLWAEFDPPPEKKSDPDLTWEKSKKVKKKLETSCCCRLPLTILLREFPCYKTMQTRLLR